MPNSFRDFDNWDKAAAEELGRAVDALLKRRKAGDRGDRRVFRFPNGTEKKRNFSFEQMRMVYSGFSDLRLGNLNKAPQPSCIMQIADYLECSVSERNELLRICKYAPIPPYIIGDKLKSVIDVAIPVLEMTNLPSYLINRDWDVVLVNEYMLRVLGINEDQYNEIKRMLRGVNIIDIIFNRDVGIRNRLSSDIGGWDYVAQRNIFGFKYTNLFCEFEDWYIAKVNRWKEAYGKEFEDYWDIVSPGSIEKYLDENKAFPYYVTTMETSVGCLTFRSLLTSLGSYDYPQVISYQPIGDESMRIYCRLGIPASPRGRVCGYP